MATRVLELARNHAAERRQLGQPIGEFQMVQKMLADMATDIFAALAMRELGHLGVDVFGGIVLEPCVGGLSARVVETALDIGYGPGTGARFASLPFHHTKMVADNPGRLFKVPGFEAGG